MQNSRLACESCVQDSGGMDVMKIISGDKGRRENLAAAAGWILSAAVYYCVISLIFRGYIISVPDGVKNTLLQDLESVLIITVSVIAGLLTVRPLFRLYLKWRSYRVHPEKGWQKWKEKAGPPGEN